MKKRFLESPFLVIFVLVLFAIIYSLISLVNHYQFRTYALDLGMYNQALYSFAHLKNAYFTLGIDGVEMPFLGTHFSLVLILISPLYYLLGTYTLLVVQIGAILLGGFGVYLYARSQTKNDSIIPLVILVQFLSIWGIFSALSFDFHCNVIGAMLVIWFIYFLEKRMLIKASIFLLLVLISTETMAIWLFFIIIGLIIKNWRVCKKEYLKFELPALLFCLLYGFVIIGIIMPSLQGVGSNLQFGRYTHIGNSFGEILQTIIQRPFQTFLLLFKNTTNDIVYDGIKQELLIMVFVSGGVAMILRPVYFIMLIPIFTLKFLSNDYALWGINGQYSIEFAPILSFAIIDLIKYLKKYKLTITMFFAIVTIFFTINSINRRTSKWYNKTNYQFYSKAHYKSNLDIKRVYNALKMIPDEAKVSTISFLAPHLSFREKLYHFPIIKDAEYIVLVTNQGGTYPLSEEDFTKKIAELKDSKVYTLILDNSNLLIFEKKF